MSARAIAYGEKARGTPSRTGRVSRGPAKFPSLAKSGATVGGNAIPLGHRESEVK